jgi:O-antigen ligase
LSVIWSDFPGVAFKRWIKAIGDLVMILIVVTDEEPIAALSRLFSRTGFILLPLSVLFIKYYPGLGRFYGAWDGGQVNTGVTLDKNMLGVITFVLSLGTLWRVLGLLRSDEKKTNRRRQLLAQGTLLAFGIWLLITANSATSLVSFILGAGLLLTTNLRFIRRHTAAVHVLVLLLALTFSLIILLGGRADMAHALGRQANLARMDIWEAIIPMASNPVVGAGFESFWVNPHLQQRLAVLFPNLPLNEAHDGYIEVYLELGWVGLGLIGLILVDAYRRSVKAFRREPALGGLLLAYSLTAVIYSVTEAGFRMLNPIWIFFLLSVIEASWIAARPAATASQPLVAFPSVASQLPARSTFALGPSGGAIAGKIGR